MNDIERIVINVHSDNRMSVKPYVHHAGARLRYTCDTLHVYVWIAVGAVPQWPLIDNLALNEAISRHIPAVSLRRALTGKKRRAYSESDIEAM